MVTPHICVVKANKMNPLEQLVCSRVRARILGALFGMRAAPLHLRDIQRRVGLAVGTVRQDLMKLENMGIVVRRRDGNRVYFAAEENHPLYPELRGLVLKTVGLADSLGEVLTRDGIQCAFVFGSVAAGTDRAASDIDLMVIGTVGFRKLSGLLSGLGERLGREINPHAMTPGEWAGRVAKKDHFVGSLMKGPKLFVVGSADELEAMGR